MLMGVACIIAAVMVLRIKGHRAGGELLAAAGFVAQISARHDELEQDA
jgi:hypothetical protein